MPAYVARRAQNILNEAGLPINGAAVLLLGVTYKANIADERESPAIPLARHMSNLGAKISSTIRSPSNGSRVSMSFGSRTSMARSQRLIS